MPPHAQDLAACHADRGQKGLKAPGLRPVRSSSRRHCPRESRQLARGRDAAEDAATGAVRDNRDERGCSPSLDPGSGAPKLRLCLPEPIGRLAAFVDPPVRSNRTPLGTRNRLGQLQLWDAHHAANQGGSDLLSDKDLRAVQLPSATWESRSTMPLKYRSKPRPERPLSEADIFNPTSSRPMPPSRRSAGLCPCRRRDSVESLPR